MSELPRQNPLGLSIYTFTNERQEGKTGLFLGWVPGDGGGLEQRVNEDKRWMYFVFICKK
jgi:hypothetical protein